MIKVILEKMYEKIHSVDDIRSLNVLLEGDPSCGKSYLCEQFAKEKKIPFVVLDMPNIIIETVTGIPYRIGDDVKSSVPTWLKELGDDGLLLLDEFNSADDDIQKIMLALLSDRRINQHRLGKKVMIVAAQNEFRQCNNYKMSPAVLSRFEKWSISFDYDDWRNNYLPSKLTKWELSLLDGLVAEGLTFSKGSDFLKDDNTTTARSVERWLVNSKEDISWLEQSVNANLSKDASNIAKIYFHSLKDKKNKQNEIFNSTKKVGFVNMVVTNKKKRAAYDKPKPTAHLIL